MEPNLNQVLNELKNIKNQLERSKEVENLLLRYIISWKTKVNFQEEAKELLKQYKEDK